MFCGMTFTTTGIEFGKSEPRILRIDEYRPLADSAHLPQGQRASADPNLVIGTTQSNGKVPGAPHSRQKGAAGASSAKPMKTQKGALVEITGAHLGSSSTPSSSSSAQPHLPSLSPTAAKGHYRRPAEAFKALKALKAKGEPRDNPRSRSSPSSVTSPVEEGQFREFNKSDAGKGASAAQPKFKGSESSGVCKSQQDHNNSQPVTKKGTKRPLDKHVRFAMDAPERVASSDPDFSMENSSSDGSNCSYIDSPPVTELESNAAGYRCPPDASKSRGQKRASMGKYNAKKSTTDLPHHAKRQPTASKMLSKGRSKDPIVVIWSDSDEGDGAAPVYHHPAAVGTALKRLPAARYLPTASSDDKENDLQYDDRFGIAFHDV